MENKLDFGGIFVAFICVIHCVTLPLIANMFPVLLSYSLDNIWVDSILLIISLIIGIKILLVKYKQHHKILPILIFCLGIVMLFIKIFFFKKEIIWWSAIALSLLVIAHICNILYSNISCKK